MSHFKFVSIVTIFIFTSISSLKGIDDSTSQQAKEWEAFPILNYDTDVGFGYGAKVFLYSLFEREESYDITIYNSTKGERWYQLIFSYPDKQRRHGKEYGSAIDIIFDYDKWVNFNFYSIQGNDFSKSTGKVEKYTKEPISLTAVWSKTLSEFFIVEAGLKFSSISCYDIKPDETLKEITLAKTQHISLILNFLYDNRTDLINPSSGFLIQLNNEFANDTKADQQSFIKNKILLQWYFSINILNSVIATRIVYERISKAMFPNKLALGGNNTIRGIPQDRYISESYYLLNEEIRIPIWWRFGGIVGSDIGYSNSSPGIIINSVFGVRFFMDNFVVRADFGIGKESSGFYFNFGHLF